MSMLSVLKNAPKTFVKSVMQLYNKLPVYLISHQPFSLMGIMTDEVIQPTMILYDFP